MLSNIKIFSDIIFAMTASIIAVLTYKAAKETILQPVRTEVIKKQTELLIEVITLVNNESSILDKIDYHGIIVVNIFDSLLKCGSIFNKHEEVKEFVKNNSKTALLDITSNFLDEYEVSESFFEEKRKENHTLNEKKHLEAKEGKYKIITVNLTQKFTDFNNQINKIINDPFIPKEIKKMLESLTTDIRNNIMVHMKKIIEKVVCESAQKNFRAKPDIVGIYNNFNHIRISHEDLISKIHSEIRRYLKIDSMP